MGAGLTWKSQHNYTCNSVAPSHHNLPGDTRHGADTVEDDGKVVTKVVEAEADDRSEIFSVLDSGLDKKKNGDMLIRLDVHKIKNVMIKDIIYYNNYISRNIFVDD